MYLHYSYALIALFYYILVNEVNDSFNISLSIFAAGIFTIIFSLCGGQPLSSIGPSGPGFILETVIAYVRQIEPQIHITPFELIVMVLVCSSNRC